MKCLLTICTSLQTIASGPTEPNLRHEQFWSLIMIVLRLRIIPSWMENGDAHYCGTKSYNFVLCEGFH